MKYLARIEVSLKPGHSDPEGETTMRLLRGLGYKVESVSVSKVYTVTFESETLDAAWSKADEISRRVLSNPTKDRYTVAVEAHP